MPPAKSKFLLESFEGLGTRWYVEVFNHILTEETVEEQSCDLQEYIIRFGNKYSRFKQDSFLNKFNSEKSCLYDENLFKMLSLGETSRIDTEGVFDICIKKDLEKAGYRSVPIDDLAEINPAGEIIPGGRFTCDGEKIYMTSGDLQVDLGGVGKGYLIDLLSEKIKGLGYENFIINGGGDMYVASDHEKGLEVFLEDPFNEGEILQSIFLKNESLCGSSTLKRSWIKDGKKQNHILDLTGRSVGEVGSFVIAQNAVIADIYATVACIVSDKGELEKLARNNNLQIMRLERDSSSSVGLTVI